MKTYRPRLIIDLPALARNYQTAQARRPKAETGAVVKANAYGLGIAAVAPALAEAGCRSFFTAYGFEGVTLRKSLAAFPDCQIYILNGPDPDTINTFHKHTLTPTLNTLEQIALWREQGRGPAILHIDTAMNRLGLSTEEARSLLADPTLTEGLEISHLISHYANSANPTSPANEIQWAAFTKAATQLRTLFPRAAQSLSASGGLFLPFITNEHLTRPGIALYGIGPQDIPEPSLKNVATLKAPVLQIRHLHAGQPVGYSGLWRAPAPTTIATLGIGYGDGYPRHLSNCGHVWLGGARCPVVGNVSMDLTCVDISACQTQPEVGTLAECFGPHVSVEKIAALAGTIAYELLVNLGPRVHRFYQE